MDFDFYMFILVFYLLMIPFSVLIVAITFPIKRKSVLWLFGFIWPLIIPICVVIAFLSFITEEIDTIIKSR